MTSILIVEDGSLVTDANSYADIETIKSFAELRGFDLGFDDPLIENRAIKAMDYIEAKRNEFKGTKVDISQELQFPRNNVQIDGFDVPSDSIPKELVKAQCQLVIEQTNGIEIMPTQSEAAIKKETVGPISTEYAVSEGSSFSPFISSVDALLQPLLKTGIGGFSLTTVRV